MYETIIFAIVFYLIIINPFIKLQFVEDKGIFLIIKRTEYLYDPKSGSYKEELIIKIKQLIDFTKNYF